MLVEDEVLNLAEPLGKSGCDVVIEADELCRMVADILSELLCFGFTGRPLSDSAAGAAIGDRVLISDIESGVSGCR
ncbi:hypothetical protein AU189_11630 [Mycolicibacterium acapulense]|nr:hypothetical protein AU189_11630 [Mycolicibacterium acapulense]